MKALKAVLRLLLRSGKDREAVRQALGARVYPEVAPIPRSLRRISSVEEDKVLGCKVLTLRPKSGDSQRMILFFHGGSLVYQMQSAHWLTIKALIGATGASIMVPIYPLAPENTFEPAYALIKEVYERLLKTRPADEIIFFGDSAGAGIALAQIPILRDSAVPLPRRIILLSPWLDLSLANPAIAGIEKEDVMLSSSVLRMTGCWWAGNQKPGSSTLSPLRADLAGSPPIHIFHGTADILFPDSQQLRDTITAAGGEVELKTYEGAFHVFMAVPFLPESVDVLRRVTALILR